MQRSAGLELIVADTWIEGFGLETGVGDFKENARVFVDGSYNDMWMTKVASVSNVFTTQRLPGEVAGRRNKSNSTFSEQPRFAGQVRQLQA